MAIINFIYWNTDGGNAGLPVGSIVGTRITPLPDEAVGVTSPYLHEDLLEEIDYYYVVVAYDTVTGLYSVASNEISGTPYGLPKTTGQIVW